jgi:2-oxoglutarate dehydrogenase E1 component
MELPMPLLYTSSVHVESKPSHARGVSSATRPQSEPEAVAPSPDLPPPLQAPAAGEEFASGFGVNAGVVEEIRQRYEVDPASVDPGWAELFETCPAAEAHAGIPGPCAIAFPGPCTAEKCARALRLIHSYRARGHRIADVDPLGGRPSYFPELDPAHYGFGSEDLDQPCLAGDLPGGPVQPLRAILDKVRQTYCRSVGVEFTHIQDPGRKVWLQKRMEETDNETALTRADRLRTLERLSAAELFERFLHTKFVGQKRFSLEGAESLIPLIDTLVEDAPANGVREFVIGMAHRGRLNVLSNILDKSLESIFGEFEDIELGT